MAFGWIMVLFLLAIELASPAHAYLDPGTGSYIFQLTAAFLFGGLLLVKQSWERVKSFLSSIIKRLTNR